MLPTVQKLILPSLLAFLTAITVFFSSPKQLSLQKYANHKTEKVLGTNVRLTPTPTAENQHEDPVKIVPTSTPATSTHPEYNSKSLEAPITPTPSGISSQQQVSEIPSPTVTPSMQNTMVYAKTTITASGKTIQLSMQYPSLGGPITGTISGDCSGTLTGTYAGPTTQTLHGTGNATCPMGLLSIPVSLTFSGKLISSSLANISYTATALGKTENGTTQLVLTQ